MVGILEQIYPKSFILRDFPIDQNVGTFKYVTVYCYSYIAVGISV